MKAQSQLENLLVAAMLLVAVLMIFLVAVGQFRDATESAKARAAIDLLGGEADYTYAHGAGTVRYVDVTFPDNVKSINVSGHRIHMVVTTSAGDTDYFAYTAGGVVGGIPDITGRQLVPMRRLDSGRVQVGELKLLCVPEKMEFTLTQGESASGNLSAINGWEQNLTGVSAFLSGGAGLLDIGAPVFELRPGESRIVAISASAPPGMPAGTYSAQVKCNCTAGYEDISEITVRVLPAYKQPRSCAVTPPVANLSGATYKYFSAACQDNQSQAAGCPPLSWSCGAGAMFPADSESGSTLLTSQSGNGTYTLRANSGTFNCTATVYLGGVVPKPPLQPILFITEGSVPDENELRWISWLANHSSNEGYNWSFDIYSDAQVRSGEANVYDYKMVVMAAFSQVSGIESALTPYMLSGGVVTLLGDGVWDGPYELGFANSYGSAGWTSKTYVTNNSHYVTLNFTTGYADIYDGWYGMYWDSAGITGARLAQFSAINTNPTLTALAVGQARQLCTWGAYRPDHFLASGDLLTTRLIDFCLGASYLENVTNLGPLVTHLAITPRYPDFRDNITVNATGDDTGRGNNTIQQCQMSLDGGGWLPLNPNDGTYDQVVENVSRAIGNQSLGAHNITAKCQDILGDWGPDSTIWFNVTRPGKGPGGPILFITDNPNPDVKERAWLDWLDTHNSAEGYNWSYNVTTRQAVIAGYNITGYRLVIMAKYTPGVGTYAVLKDYIASGGVVLMTGDALEKGPRELNYTASDSTSSSETQIYVNNNQHYITQGFDIGKISIETQSATIWRTPGFNGTSLAWGVQANVKVENQTSIGDSSSGGNVQLVTWGPATPDKFNYRGNVLTTRIIDYCLGARWGGGGSPQGPLVTSLFIEPLIPYTNTPVRVNATGDDTGRGNTNVTMCQRSLDAGAWVNMTANDGAYGSMVEKAYSNMGTLEYGTHLVVVRCRNALGLIGPTEQVTFRVLRPYTPIIFLVDGPNPNAVERDWMDWLDSHTSGEGYNWTYEYASRTDIVQETLLLTDHQLAMMADFTAGTGLSQKLLEYIAGGGVVLMAGNALQNGPRDMGYTASAGTNSQETGIYVVNDNHYIMKKPPKYNVGLLTVMTKKDQFWRNGDNLGGTIVADALNNGARDTGHPALADRSGAFFTWGPQTTASFNADGNQITTRVIDYCMGAR